MYTFTKRRERYHPEDAELKTEYPNHLNPFGSQDDAVEVIESPAVDRPSSMGGGGGPTDQMGPLGPGRGGGPQEGDFCLVASHANKPTHIKYEFRSPRPPASSWLDRAPTPPPPTAPPQVTSPEDSPGRKPVPAPRSTLSSSTTSPTSPTSPTKPPKPPPPLISPTKLSPSEPNPPMSPPTKVPPPRPPPPSAASLTASSSSSSLNTQQIGHPQPPGPVPRTPPRQRRHQQNKGQLGSTRSLQCQPKTTTTTTLHLGKESSSWARSEGHIEGIHSPLGSGDGSVTSPTEGTSKPLGMTNGEKAGSTSSLHFHNGSVSSAMYTGTRADSTQSLHGPPTSSCAPVPPRRGSIGGSLEGYSSLKLRKISREVHRTPVGRAEGQGQGQGRLSPGAQSQGSTTPTEDATSPSRVSRLQVTLVNGHTAEKDVEGSRNMNGVESVEEPVTPVSRREEVAGEEVKVAGSVVPEGEPASSPEKVAQRTSSENVAKDLSSENVAKDLSSENRIEEPLAEAPLVNGSRETDHTQGEPVQESAKDVEGDVVEELETTDPPFELLQIIEPGDELKTSEPGVPEEALGEVTNSTPEELGQKVENGVAQEDPAVRPQEAEEPKSLEEQKEKSSNLNTEEEKMEKDNNITEIKDNEKVKNLGIVGVQVLPKDFIAEARLRARPPPPPNEEKEYNPFDEDSPEETVNKKVEVGVVDNTKKDELQQPRTSSPMPPASSPKPPVSSPKPPVSQPVSTNPFDEDDDDDEDNNRETSSKTPVLCPPTPPPPKSAVKSINFNSTNPFEEDMSDEETSAGGKQPTDRRIPSSSSSLTFTTSISTISLPGSTITSHNKPQSSPSHPFSREEAGRMSLASRGTGVFYRGDTRTSLPPRSRKKRPAPQPPGPRPSFAKPVTSPSPSEATQVSESQVTSPVSPTSSKEQMPPSDRIQESSGDQTKKPESPAPVSSPTEPNSPERSPVREMEPQTEKASPQKPHPEESSSSKTGAVRHIDFRTSPVRESSPKPNLIRESESKGSSSRDSSPKTRLIQGPDPMASPIRQLLSDSSPIRELSPRSSPLREPSATSPRPESYPSGSSKSSPAREMSPQTINSQDSSPRVSPVRQSSPDSVNEGQTERPEPPEDSPVWRKYADTDSGNQKVSPEDSPVWKRSPEVVGRHKTPEGSPEKRTSNGQTDRHSSPVNLIETTAPETLDLSSPRVSPSKGLHSTSKTATLRNLPPSKWFGSLTRSFRKKRKKNKEDAKDASS
ncbi:uncharacterized protein LOC143037898 isoform X2 [Oratosquilla oratoria]|uniref:uncharacterized protein LOC143037898 isoform X2 n=1 Tax=Oratosquilla oratoria TaxID=337810 RepID=UPI003F769F1B